MRQLKIDPPFSYNASLLKFETPRLNIVLSWSLHCRFLSTFSRFPPSMPSPSQPVEDPRNAIYRVLINSVGQPLETIDPTVPRLGPHGQFIPFCVSFYVRHPIRFFDSRRFSVIPFEEGSLPRPGDDHNAAPRQRAKGRHDAWEARWQHYPRVTHDDITVGLCDMSHVRSPEERPYQHRLGTFMEAANVNRAKAEMSGLDVVFFDKPFDFLYWLHNRAYWARNFRQEVLLRTRTKDVFAPSWHHVEFFDIPPRHRRGLYAKAMEDWVDALWVPDGLNVPNPPGHGL